VGPPPQTQAPFWQALLPSWARQLTHAVPIVPQEKFVDVMQAPVTEQQPLGQETPSHWHSPAAQCWPTGHGLPLGPQRQLPMASQRSARTGSQTRQATPAVPHAAVVSRVSHAPPEQQPFGHETASQTQAPTPDVLRQRWPDGHGASALPHTQTPLAVQVSLTVGSQTTHVPPAMPQLVVDAAAHWPPMQQPVGHEVASQMHWPEAQRWPVKQAPPIAPQLQLPRRQVSVTVGSHTRHWRPLPPHAAAVGGLMHAPEAQQVPQVVGSHTQVPNWQ
jgi:hypothetical protein